MKQNRIGRLFIGALTTLSLLCALTASTALANTDSVVYVSVPFSFTVANKTLPAGDYAIKPLSTTSQYQMVYIQSKDGKYSLIIPTRKAAAKVDSRKTEVSFKQIGDQYFLDAISNYSYGVDLRLRNHKSKIDSETHGG
jgi:hypothetical protein